MFIKEGKLDPKEVIDWLGNDPESGASDIFFGFVRNENQGKTVLKLEYESYQRMAETEADLILQEAKNAFPINRIFFQHATGILVPGDLVVVAAVTSKHRAPAFEACRFLIEELKKRVPIWKREFYADGSEWLSAHP